MLLAIIFWYSFKCFFSSAGSLGGNHDGLVRERTASFSFDIGSGSIMILLLRRGGSSARADLTRGFGTGRMADCSTPCLSNSSACSSSFSVSALASAFRPEIAAVQLFARPLIGERGVDFCESLECSDLHDGDFKDPESAATGGVPLPTLRTRSLGCLSGDVDAETGRLLDLSLRGRGDIGTLSRMKPSGMSSSPSSSSNALSASDTDLVSRFDCQLLLRGLGAPLGSREGSECGGTLGLGLR
ncbi:hypothetical protein RRF57_011226 [Xylaria bambusicola]|uniref:Secreted protein n=1 Tax=Xylaria bambusicola TaxID=326684 RepID=A0AAN7UW96_9PEZI